MRENHKNHVNHTPIKLIAMAFKGTEKSIEKASDLLSSGAARVVMDSQVSKEEKV